MAKRVPSKARGHPSSSQQNARWAILELPAGRTASCHLAFLATARHVPPASSTVIALVSLNAHQLQRSAAWKINADAWWPAASPMPALARHGHGQAGRFHSHCSARSTRTLLLGLPSFRFSGQRRRVQATWAGRYAVPSSTNPDDVHPEAKKII